jgi:uncharacterized protein involved in exopolysaccharide biosynthesis
MPHDAQTQLFTILDEERQALLHALYDQLPAIAESKGRCLESLSQTAPTKETLRALKAQIAENQQLITAALRGVAAGRKRIATLENVRDVLTTYDPSGKMTLLPTNQKTVEKKA